MKETKKKKFEKSDEQRLYPSCEPASNKARKNVMKSCCADRRQTTVQKRKRKDQRAGAERPVGGEDRSPIIFGTKFLGFSLPFSRAGREKKKKKKEKYWEDIFFLGIIAPLVTVVYHNYFSLHMV